MDNSKELEEINNNIDFQDRCDILYKLICDDLYVPMKAKELAILLGIPKGERDTLHKVLDTLMTRGMIVCTPNGKYIKSGKASDASLDNKVLGDDIDILIGTFTPGSKGFGFVRIDGTGEDIFIAKNDIITKTNNIFLYFIFSTCGSS